MNYKISPGAFMLTVADIKISNKIDQQLRIILKYDHCNRYSKDLLKNRVIFIITRRKGLSVN